MGTLLPVSSSVASPIYKISVFEEARPQTLGNIPSLLFSKSIVSSLLPPGVNSIKKLQVYFSSQTLVFTSSHRFEFSLYKFQYKPLTYDYVL